ncbi:hypothetical protein QOZ80_3BG0265740 [Eleusine coracana subsp. coracana]|nr:hypothetical protein QOZ80_3BG0265740 [Eleusine coracana subsp. coracana]
MPLRNSSPTFLSCHPPPPTAAFLRSSRSTMEAISSRKRFAVGNLEEEYEPICELGKGGFGSVVKARHRGTGHLVAIKRLANPGEGQSEVMREKRFLEACSGNPFVVGFRGVVRAPDSMELRLVMDHVGPSLRDFLRLRRADEDTPLPEPTVRAIMWQLLQGAKRMHAVHVVHRDIKPDNLLVSAHQNLIKICDLGLALHLCDAPPYTQAGTTWYMAPEVVLGKPDYDALVDAWSLGCVMAELINGEVLFFPGDNDNDNGSEAAGQQIRAIVDVLGVAVVLDHAVRHRGAASATAPAEAKPAASQVPCHGAVPARVRGTQRPAHVEPRQAAHGQRRAQAPLVRRSQRPCCAGKNQRGPGVGFAQQHEGPADDDFSKLAQEAQDPMCLS